MTTHRPVNEAAFPVKTMQNRTLPKHLHTLNQNAKLADTNSAFKGLKHVHHADDSESDMVPALKKIKTISPQDAPTKTSVEHASISQAALTTSHPAKSIQTLDTIDTPWILKTPNDPRPLQNNGQPYDVLSLNDSKGKNWRVIGLHIRDLIGRDFFRMHNPKTHQLIRDVPMRTSSPWILAENNKSIPQTNAESYEVLEYSPKPGVNTIKINGKFNATKDQFTIINPLNGDYVTTLHSKTVHGMRTWSAPQENKKFALTDTDLQNIIDSDTNHRISYLAKEAGLSDKYTDQTTYKKNIRKLLETIIRPENLVGNSIVEPEFLVFNGTINDTIVFLAARHKSGWIMEAKASHAEEVNGDWIYKGGAIPEQKNGTPYETRTIENANNPSQTTTFIGLPRGRDPIGRACFCIMHPTKHRPVAYVSDPSQNLPPWVVADKENQPPLLSKDNKPYDLISYTPRNTPNAAPIYLVGVDVEDQFLIFNPTTHQYITTLYDASNDENSIWLSPQEMGQYAIDAETLNQIVQMDETNDDDSGNDESLWSIMSLPEKEMLSAIKVKSFIEPIVRKENYVRNSLSNPGYKVFEGPTYEDGEEDCSGEAQVVAKTENGWILAAKANTQFDDVMALFNKQQTIYQELETAGYNFTLGAAGGGTYFSPQLKQIVIDKRYLSNSNYHYPLLVGITHEMAHAKFHQSQFAQLMREFSSNPTKEKYKLHRSMDEGNSMHAEFCLLEQTHNDESRKSIQEYLKKQYPKDWEKANELYQHFAEQRSNASDEHILEKIDTEARIKFGRIYQELQPSIGITGFNYDELWDKDFEFSAGAQNQTDLSKECSSTIQNWDKINTETKLLRRLENGKILILTQSAIEKIPGYQQMMPENKKLCESLVYDALKFKDKENVKTTQITAENENNLVEVSTKFLRSATVYQVKFNYDRDGLVSNLEIRQARK